MQEAVWVGTVVKREIGVALLKIVALGVEVLIAELMEKAGVATLSVVAMGVVAAEVVNATTLDVIVAVPRVADTEACSGVSGMRTR